MNGIELLGATLLHFLWQGILIAAVYAAVRRGAVRPGTRYLLACAALAAMAAAPVATWIALRPPSPDAVALPSSFPAPHAAFTAVGIPGERLRFLAAGYEGVPSAWLSWVAAVWMAGVVVFWLRLLGGWMMAERLRRRQVRLAPAQWQRALDRLRARLRIPRPVQLAGLQSRARARRRGPLASRPARAGGCAGRSAGGTGRAPAASTSWPTSGAMTTW